MSALGKVRVTLAPCATCGAAAGVPCAGFVLYDFNAQQPLSENERAQLARDGSPQPSPCRNGRARMAARVSQGA